MAGNPSVDEFLAFKNRFRSTATPSYVVIDADTMEAMDCLFGRKKGWRCSLLKLRAALRSRKLALTFLVVGAATAARRPVRSAMLNALTRTICRCPCDSTSETGSATTAHGLQDLASRRENAGLARALGHTDRASLTPTDMWLARRRPEYLAMATPERRRQILSEPRP